MFFAFIIIVILSASLVGYQDAKKAFLYRDAKSPYFFDQFASARHYGLFPLWLWQIRTYDKLRLSQDEINYYKETLLNNGKNAKDSVSGNPNIILIIVESLESWTINARYKNKEITPNLNSLIANEDAFFAPYVTDQTHAGRSSDAQLIINTGLLPVNSGATSFRYQNNVYFSLPDALHQKGYISAVFSGGSSTFWNYHAFAKAQGFQQIFSIEDYKYTADDIFKFGLKDHIFFPQTLKVLSQLESPFFAELITLSSHQPFDLPDDLIKKNFDCEGYFCKYLLAINYADHSIGVFIDELQKTGIFENTVIIITADHKGLPPNLEKQNFVLENDKLLTIHNRDINTIPLIIINGPIKDYYDDMLNQADIYPTLIDFFAPDYKWHGLGKSIISYLQTDSSETTVGMNDNSRRNLHVISDSLIRGDFFRHIGK